LSNQGNNQGCNGYLGYCVTADTTFTPADFNGDGRADLLLHGSTGDGQWYGIANSLGTKFAGPSTDYHGCGGMYGYCVTADTQFIAGDSDGDNQADVFLHGSTGNGAWYGTSLTAHAGALNADSGAESAVPDLLIKVTGAMGGATAVGYT